MIYAIDFDGTLTDPRVQCLVHRLVADGHDVWCITARDADSCTQPYFKSILQRCCIPLQKLIHTDGKDKWPIIESMGFDVFIDNSKKEVIDVACHTKCIPLQFIAEL